MPKRRRGDSADFSLTQEQVQRVLASCLDLDERVTIGLQLFLGLRASEACHLQANWVTEEGDIKIPSRMTCNCAECARARQGLWKPKTRAGARTLPIPKRMKKDLSELLKLKPYGLGISRIGLYYRTKTVLYRAKIRFQGVAGDTAFPHALRATAASLLAAGGMSAVNLCYFMGWKNIAIGEHYISVVKAKQGALEQARQIFG